jgi:hypothetical protein
MDENDGRGRKQFEKCVRGKTTISIFTLGEKWRERTDNNFKFHTRRKMAGEERLQFQFSYMKKNGGRGTEHF